MFITKYPSDFGKKIIRIVVNFDKNSTMSNMCGGYKMNRFYSFILFLLYLCFKYNWAITFDIDWHSILVIHSLVVKAV